MRFYLNFPLVAGFALMATTACLGVLQFAAARGGYAGLALFTDERKQGVRLGVGLALSAVIAYAFLAPEILTPGPAGAELVEMFFTCAALALGFTLVGAHWRMGRATARKSVTDRRACEGRPLVLGDLPARLLYPPSSARDTAFRGSRKKPAVVIIPDPARFVVLPVEFPAQLCRAGIASLVLDAQGVAGYESPYSHETLLGNLSNAVVQLSTQSDVDKRCIGLVGLGLAGDAVLRAAQAAPAGSLARVAVAVSPVSIAHGLDDVEGWGVYWLRELSYIQCWRWRRSRPFLQNALAELNAIRPARDHYSTRVTTALFYGEDAAVTTRIDDPDLVSIGVPTPRHFTLLEIARARQTLIQWLQEQLESDE